MLIVNGTTIENVVYNGQDLDKLIYNDVVVFEKSGFNAEQVLIDFDYIRNSDGTYTITDWKGTYQGQESTECIVPNKKEIRLYTKTITSQLNDYYEVVKDFNLTFQIYGFTELDFANLKVDISFSNPEICNYNPQYTLTNVNQFQTNLIIHMQTLLPGTTSAKITLTSGKHIYSKFINIKLLEWLVEAVPNASYGFKLNDNGFYESQNKGKGQSYSLCKVTIKNPLKFNVYFDCISYGENGCDYGYLSKVNSPLKLHYELNDDDATYHSFKYASSPNIQTVNYGPLEEGEIYVKYRKDYSRNFYNDTLQFKVRFGD